MTEEERDKFVADEIRAGRCPFGNLSKGQSIAHCPSGFPGCGCGDELLLNSLLADLAPEPSLEQQLLPEGVEVFRASGDCLCGMCGRPYREHTKYAYPSGMGHCVRDCEGRYLHL